MRTRKSLYVRCAKSEFPYESFLKQHLPIHKETKDFMCPSHSCGKTFKSQQSLKTHMELHSGEKFLCKDPGCTKTFALDHYRCDHMNMQHSDPYQCKHVLDGCTFTTWAQTTLHCHEDYYCTFKPDED